MQITLLHNPSAGENQPEQLPTADDLVRIIRRAGHEVDYFSTDDDDDAWAARPGADIIVAAGGDGTVATVAKRLAGTRTPMGIIPIGTANNIARALGLTVPIDQIIAGWASGSRERFDIGAANHGDKTHRFVEATGVGWFARVLHHADAESDTPLDGDRDHHHFRYLERLLAATPAVDWTLTVDDAEIAGRFLLIEALTIASIGSTLTLAPRASASDGLLDVVVAFEEHRGMLMDYIRARGLDQEPTLELPTYRGARVRISDAGTYAHVDDEPIVLDAPLDVRARVATVDILVPGPR
jgi:diacylglycerol kinase (ATP)